MLEVKDVKEAVKAGDIVWGNDSFSDHEQVVFFYDKKTRLKAIFN